MIDREDDRASRRIQVQADDVANLVDELRIVGHLQTICFEVRWCPATTSLVCPSARYRILERHGRSLDGTGDLDTHDAQPPEQLALSACYGAAASGLGLDGLGALFRPLLPCHTFSLGVQVLRVPDAQAFSRFGSLSAPAAALWIGPGRMGFSAAF